MVRDPLHDPRAQTIDRSNEHEFLDSIDRRKLRMVRDYAHDLKAQIVDWSGEWERGRE